jgi:hypothetical protein
VDDNTSPDNLAKARLEAIRQDRIQLIEQIRQSQDTIARSLELIRRIDTVLRKAGEKP